MPLAQAQARFLWSAVVVLLIQLPLLLYYANSIQQFLGFLVLFAMGTALLGALYRLLVRQLRADATEPMPWYGSPLVWLGVPLALAWLAWWLS